MGGNLRTNTPLTPQLESHKNYENSGSNGFQVSGRMQKIKPDHSKHDPKLEVKSSKSFRESFQENILMSIAVGSIVGGMTGAFAGPPGIFAGIGIGIVVGTTICLIASWCMRNKPIDNELGGPQHPYINTVDPFQHENDLPEPADYDYG